MKKVVLFDIDGKIPNLALMKIGAYHKRKGHRVTLRKTVASIDADTCYASAIFHCEKSLDRIEELERIYGSKLTVGGSGISLKTRLPASMDGCFPDYALYAHRSHAIGFLTRGCPNRCPFCLVHRKERRFIDPYAALADFVPKGQKNVMLLDNNLLASENAKGYLKALIDGGYKVNFSQSLDISYLDEEMFELLERVDSVNSRFTKRMYYFGCNTVEQCERFYEKRALLKAFGREAVTVLIMYGFDTTLSTDLKILKMTRALGLVPFVQEYMPIPGVPARVPEDFFDTDLDELSGVRFRTNGRNNEKYFRYVNRLYFRKFGNYYKPLLEAMYRYNNKKGIERFLRTPELISVEQYKRFDRGAG